jgi:hypothetical protein
MADYKLDKYNSDRAALKKKYPDARMTPYIDKMKGETWDSEQGKASKEYGDIVDKFNQPDAGAGRGKQGGPTAKELKKYEDKQNEGIYTAEKGKPPTDPEGAKKKGGMIKMASGGMTASKRADGIAQRGKTRGTMVMCGGGMSYGKKK